MRELVEFTLHIKLKSYARYDLVGIILMHIQITWFEFMSLMSCKRDYVTSYHQSSKSHHVFDQTSNKLKIQQKPQIQK